MSIDQQIDALFAKISEPLLTLVFYSVPIVDGMEIKLILVWLVAAAVIFTLYFGFVNIRYFGHAIKLLSSSDVKVGEEGYISRFQALTTSVSGTVGLGNIAGVAVAVSVGGPGATFWMILMGFLGMSTKFVEVTLGVKYRQHPDKEHPEKISGGPMYYLRYGLEKKFDGPIGKVLAGIYAACMTVGAFGAASLFQTNQVYRQVVNITGGMEASIFADKGWLIGLIMVVLVGLVIIGGIKSIAAVTSKLVPVMCLLYLAAGLIVLGIFYQNIPHAIVTIFHEALTPEAGIGAVLGALVMGVQRATFSNEAGLGTAAVAHSAVKTNKPITQGLSGMLEPFIDTVVICTMTALVIVVTGAYTQSEGMEGVTLTSRAFEMGVSWFPYVLFMVVFLFAYSTLITWSYYGVKAFTYLFGNNTFNENLYKILFCIMIVVGGSANLDNVIGFTDASVFIMGIPNIIGLYLLAPEVKADLKAYLATLKK